MFHWPLMCIDLKGIILSVKTIYFKYNVFNYRKYTKKYIHLLIIYMHSSSPKYLQYIPTIQGISGIC